MSVPALNCRVIPPPEGRKIKDVCLYGELYLIVCDDYSAWWLEGTDWRRIEPVLPGENATFVTLEGYGRGS